MTTSRNIRLGDERPLTARSVLASALLGENPPRLPVAQLVRIAAAFQINENRARVALSRMASNAEVRSDDGTYELISHALLERQQRQRDSRAGQTKRWEGDWLVAIIGPQTASPEQRVQRRTDLRRSRFAEYRDGVWVRPNNLAPSVVMRSDVHVVQVKQAQSTSNPDLSFEAAVSRLWDLAGWATRAQDLVTRLDHVDPSNEDNLADGFVLSASCLRHFQSDPLLPAVLLPSDWPGRALRSRYQEWDSRYRRVLGALG
jgi:phenylacetic acid degradation operon negative regulatory protein